MTEDDVIDGPQDAQTPVVRSNPDLRRLTVPVVGIFIILLLQGMVWASDFLIPLIAAVLGYFSLNRPRRWLQHLGLPPFASAILFTAIVSAVIALLLVRFSAPTAQFIEDLPALIAQVQEKLRQAGGTLEAINDASVAAEEVVGAQEEGTVSVEVVSNTGLAATLFSMAPGFLSRILFALLMLFFLIASGDMFLTKTVQSFDRFGDKRRAVEVFYSIEDRLGYYLGGITFINIGLGVAVAIAMASWGLPGPLVFGFMAFCLNFVPFLGGLLGASIAAAVAFVNFDETWIALAVFATYIALTSIEGQFVTPLLISRRMRLNTTVVFLTVAFFAWIWSVMGMVVALPILIVIKIACDETESLRTVGRFLGGAENDASLATQKTRRG